MVAVCPFSIPLMASWWGTGRTVAALLLCLVPLRFPRRTMTVHWDCALGLCTGGYERSRPGMTMARAQPQEAYGHNTEGAAP
jgi:hypothetical protein